MSERLTIATANTQMGRAIREPGGLAGLKSADVILLQEVQMGQDELATKLSDDIGLSLGHYDDDFGLAIAIDSKYTIQSRRHRILQARGTVGRLTLPAKEHVNTFRLRGRGLLALTLETPDGTVFTAATTHPTVKMKSVSRNAQVRAIPNAISDMPDPLVLAGDMNHWRHPHRVDRQMYESTGLTPVEITGSTFDVSQTRYALLGKIIRFDAQLDAMLYRGKGLRPIETELIDISSDHHAVKTTFEIDG